MKIYSVVALVTALFLLGGCATSSTEMMRLPDGRILSAANLRPSIDRSVTYTQLFEEDGVDKDGAVKLRQISADLTVGSTVSGDVLRGVTGGTGAAFIQGEAAKSVAKTRAKASACPPGAVNCNSTVIGVGGANAQAGSNAVSQSNTAFDATIQSGCPNCAAIPID